MIKQITLLLSSLFFSIAVFAKCEGSFVNPITDVCWRCLFPLKIAGITIPGLNFDNIQDRFYIHHHQYSLQRFH